MSKVVYQRPKRGILSRVLSIFVSIFLAGVGGFLVLEFVKGYWGRIINLLTVGDFFIMLFEIVIIFFTSTLSMFFLDYARSDDERLT